MALGNADKVMVQRVVAVSVSDEDGATVTVTDTVDDTDTLPETVDDSDGVDVAELLVVSESV